MSLKGIFVYTEGYSSLIRLIFILLLIFLICSQSFAITEQEKIDLFAAVEDFFVNLKERNYSKVWESLSSKSQKVIAEDVLKAEKKAGNNVTIEKIFEDFRQGKGFAKDYWDSFLVYFNPDIVLKDSFWEVGKVEKEYAEVLVRYKKSEKPTILKLYKEKDLWKFGLVESFWVIKDYIE
jgi:hypothetical protein